MISPSCANQKKKDLHIFLTQGLVKKFLINSSFHLVKKKNEKHFNNIFNKELLHLACLSKIKILEGLHNLKAS